MKAWEKNIRRVEPYVAGEQPDIPNMIKLNTNENPYPPAPGVLEEIRKYNGEDLRRYPDQNGEPLSKLLASYYQVKENQVFTGVGSDDVLAIAFMTFFHSQKPILFPDITYSFYPVWANLFNIPFERPKLDENFNIKKEDYYKENGGVVLANPNAPTSIYEKLETIRDILTHNQDVIVILDEAYIDFGGISALKLLPAYDNLLIIQTFSKSRSLAGLRIGYAIGSEELIQAMKDVKHSFNSYTMNRPSLIMGAKALKEQDYFKDKLGKIVNTRERMKKELKELGFDFPDSKTNFLFITHKNILAEDLYKALKKENIFVRYFKQPRIDHYLRITIGTEEEMDQLILFLREVVW